MSFRWYISLKEPLLVVTEGVNDSSIFYEISMDTKYFLADFRDFTGK